MANFTKKAIKESFIKLLNERPISKISVKDIVEDCGINRNSFYYHFQDIPSLVSEIVGDEAEKIISMHPHIDSIEECLDVAIQSAQKNRRIVMNIYNSSNRETYLHYMMETCEKVVSLYLQNIFHDEISNDDRALVIKYYKCALFGIIISWLKSGMRDDIGADFHRLLEFSRNENIKIFKRQNEKQTTEEK